MSREQVRYFGVDGKRLIGKRTGFRDERAVAMEMIYRYAGISQMEIGRMIGLHSSEPGVYEVTATD